MKVSQLLHIMDKTDIVTIFDRDKNIAEHQLYQGQVRGVKKDNPINKYHICKVFAYDDAVIMEAALPKLKGD